MWFICQKTAPCPAEPEFLHTGRSPDFLHSSRFLPGFPVDKCGAQVHSDGIVPDLNRIPFSPAAITQPTPVCYKCATLSVQYLHRCAQKSMQVSSGDGFLPDTPRFLRAQQLMLRPVLNSFNSIFNSRQIITFGGRGVKDTSPLQGRRIIAQTNKTLHFRRSEASLYSFNVY